jgi:multidrug efflux pump subunit AcrA (membrane-fusion protein)
MNKDRRWVWIVLGILAVLLIGWIFIGWWNRDVVKVKTAGVIRGTIEQVVTASGYVDAPLYELGSKMGGKIAEWKVKEGDQVKKGQLLATFDNYEQALNDFNRTQQLYQDGAASKQAYDVSKTMFDASRIAAPDRGIVGKINYVEGETVVPGQPAVVIVNYDRSWVNAQIDEIDIAGVKIGDKVKVTSDVYPDKVYDGDIYWIAPLAELRKVGGRIKLDEESYVFPCKIKFLGKHDELKVNMSVNVDITTKRKFGALIIPREALFSRDDSSYVYTISRNRNFEKKIEIGIRSFSSVEASAGLSEGELVAISNISKLKNRGRVNLER